MDTTGDGDATVGAGGDTVVVIVGGAIAVGGEGGDEQVEEEEDLASVDRFERLSALLAFSIFFKGV